MDRGGDSRAEQESAQDRLEYRPGVREGALQCTLLPALEVRGPGGQLLLQRLDGSLGGLKLGLHPIALGLYLVIRRLRFLYPFHARVRWQASVPASGIVILGLVDP